MKLLLRGLLTVGVGLMLSLAAKAKDPDTKANPAAHPATSSTTVSADCGCGATTGSAHRVLRGRIGRLGDNLGQRTDRVAEAYIGVNQRISGIFQRLAGPPVEPTVGSGFAKHKGGPYTQPGTVVFPHHPFVRSPRDFFMMEQP